MRVLQFIHGTVDFVFATSIPRVLGWLVHRGVHKHVFRDRVRFHDGSPWLSVRIYKSLAGTSALPQQLWHRAVHVTDEDEMIPLSEDLRVQRDIEYVIQEHHADRAGRHYDLRLVFRDQRGKPTSVSWAIPMKGKRADVSGLPKPGDRWAAIRQPDHEVEYNEFEGTIPSGIGKGTVRIYSSGTADVYKIEDGHVHFRIHSGPAKGSYVLVSTDGVQGLLVSKKPEAVDVWTKHAYTKKPHEVLEALEDQACCVAERKVDGAAVELRVADNRVRTFSHRVSKRTGSLVEHTDRLAHLDDTVTEGLGGTRLRAEAWHPRGVNFLSGTLNSDVDRARQLQKTAGPIRLDVFDITHHKGEDVRHLPYAQRRELYEEVVRELKSPHIQAVRAQHSNFPGFYESQVNLKGAPTDGIVVKQEALGYDEKPWVKVKPSDTVDCTVVGLSEGLGKHSGRLGALTVQTPEGKLVQVGTGFTDWERQWIWDHRQDVDQEVARVSFHVRGGEASRTGPRFESWHPDKSEAALKMYAEVMGADPYALKSAAGWRAA